MVDRNIVIYRITEKGDKVFQQKLLEPFSKWPSTAKRGFSPRDTRVVYDQADHPYGKKSAFTAICPIAGASVCLLVSFMDG